MKKFVYLARKFLSKYDLLDTAGRRAYITFQTTIFRLRFFNSTINQNKFIFECFSGRSISDSPYSIYLMLTKLRPDAEYIWVTNIEARAEHRSILGDSVKLVDYRSNEYFKEYSQSAYWISNCRIPLSIHKNKDQTYVQTWHGTPLKKLGCDIGFSSTNASSKVGNDLVYVNEGRRVDFFISPSRYASNCFKTAFKINSSAILETGYPRNDILVTHSCNRDYINSLKKKLGISLSSRVILYAPTWRDNNYDIKAGYQSFENLLDDKSFLDGLSDTVFLFRGHYFTKLSKKSSSFIDVSSHNSINDLMLVSDCLITDYSSLFFDYAILKKPIYFYMPDLETYRDSVRGFYFDISSGLPGTISFNLEQLKETINTAPNLPKIEEFNKVFNGLEDGDSTKRLLIKLGLCNE